MDPSLRGWNNTAIALFNGKKRLNFKRMRRRQLVELNILTILIFHMNYNDTQPNKLLEVGGGGLKIVFIFKSIHD